MQARLVIAGTGSGSGKTTLTLGLMAALKHKGFTVQGFKAGPDFIDPGFHTVVTGRPSRNLDSWMLDPRTLREVFLRGSDGADISIIEGMMGLFDGKQATGLEGSTAELSLQLQAPILLIVSAAAMARSAAAVVLGFQLMEPEVRIAGVIINEAGGEGHYRLLKSAIEARCDVSVIGYLEHTPELTLSERHLGLIPAWERHDLQKKLMKLAGLIRQTVDLERLWEVASTAPDLKCEHRIFPVAPSGQKVQIAVARDAAFHFYYPENLELLELNGAELVEFAPLNGEPVPQGACGLYLGGGFPEEYAEQLSSQSVMLDSLKESILQGLPTVAECGGYMLLADSLIDAKGNPHRMAGVIPAEIRMQSRLAAIGYREASGHADSPILVKGEMARGHEFHYSVIEYHGDRVPAYDFDMGGRRAQEGYVCLNLIAGYTHLHFASNPRTAQRFVHTCLTYRKGKGGR